MCAQVGSWELAWSVTVCCPPHTQTQSLLLRPLMKPRGCAHLVECPLARSLHRKQPAGAGGPHNLPPSSLLNMGRADHRPHTPHCCGPGLWVAVQRLLLALPAALVFLGVIRVSTPADRDWVFGGAMVVANLGSVAACEAVLWQEARQRRAQAAGPAAGKKVT